ncbi:RHS repeat domain-containing protein [Yersinia aldovae]|uniref:RHS repeat domain-containing protein n=2 Tax=Yersinia aldovae TaxID=29483 RepID=UPI0012E08756|nr:RHS repeat-associated core domain-containing protein [Yersinia aldovae]
MYTVVLIYSLADAFGRRIRKLRLVSNAPAASTQGDEPTASEKTGQVGYEYLWSGDQLIEEVPIYADGTAAYEQSIHWLYAPGALTPTARYENGKLHYVVADHLGTPRELLNEQGKVVWANRLSTWGRAELWRQAANDEDNVTCNLRFAGQYADAESGLHYNRFRYYDGETGQYLCPDPIGLLGGVNPYGYVHNPLGWVDPLGLTGTDASGRPLSSLNYSVWHQAEIPADIQSGTRAQHFRNANQQLYEAIQKNPDLGQSLPPEVVAHVQPKPRGGFSDKSPPDQTWHHNAQDPTKIELVPRSQHKAPGPVQASLHPNQGGGFKALRSKCS